MAVPAFEPSGALPPGEHSATWEDVVRRFRFSTRRRELMRSMRLAFLDLKSAGCRRVFLDGSFVTAKRNPNDYDVVWDPVGVDPNRLDPVFLDFADERRSQKTRWGGEFFPSMMRERASGLTFVEYFRQVHNPPEKGIVVIDLQSMP